MKTDTTQDKKTIKTLRGVVVSTKMKDTIAVSVTRYVKDPKYKKYATVSKKYLVHAPNHTVREGDKVTIRSTRPISKRKSFELVTDDMK
jgi:small subunit ribosomal protein S17